MQWENLYTHYQQRFALPLFLELYIYSYNIYIYNIYNILYNNIIYNIHKVYIYIVHI